MLREGPGFPLHAQRRSAEDRLRLQSQRNSKTISRGNTNSDVNAAKVLAFSFPQLPEGIKKAEGKQALLTAVVEDDLPSDDETVSFARETLEHNAISIAPVA